ncbi:MAG: Trm112 family protein [Oceanisphaera sp.]|uniref:Trm112 family protein n=1 Tax=Oceanisphaera sp. TaxID=1929979 RepID=UPI003F9D3D23
MAIDAKLVDIIACPVCKGKLQLDRAHNELVCRFDKLAYPITENIPVLLESSARKLSSDELPA